MQVKNDICEAMRFCVYPSPLMIARYTSAIKIDHGENCAFNIVVKPDCFENKSSYFDLLFRIRKSINSEITMYFLWMWIS